MVTTSENCSSSSATSSSMIVMGRKCLVSCGKKVNVPSSTEKSSLPAVENKQLNGGNWY